MALVTELDEVFVGQVADPQISVDAGLLQGVAGAASADAVDVGKGDFQPLLARQVDADKACHVGSYSFTRRRSPASPSGSARLFGQLIRPRPPGRGFRQPCFAGRTAGARCCVSCSALRHISLGAACGGGSRRSP